jgi:hypothetical protein
MCRRHAEGSLAWEESPYPHRYSGCSSLNSNWWPPPRGWLSAATGRLPLGSGRLVGAGVTVHTCLRAAKILGDEAGKPG